MTSRESGRKALLLARTALLKVLERCSTSAVHGRRQIGAEAAVDVVVRNLGRLTALTTRRPLQPFPTASNA